MRTNWVETRRDPQTIHYKIGDEAALSLLNTLCGLYIPVRLRHPAPTQKARPFTLSISHAKGLSPFYANP